MTASGRCTVPPLPRSGFATSSNKVGETKYGAQIREGGSPSASIDRCDGAFPHSAVGARGGGGRFMGERYRSPAQYVWEAMRALPFVVASQIRESNPRSWRLRRFSCSSFLAALLPTPLRLKFRDGCALRYRRSQASSRWCCAYAYRATGTSPQRRGAFDVVAVIVCVGLTQACIVAPEHNSKHKPGLDSAGRASDLDATLAPHAVLSARCRGLPLAGGNRADVGGRPRPRI